MNRLQNLPWDYRLGTNPKSTNYNIATNILAITAVLTLGTINCSNWVFLRVFAK